MKLKQIGDSREIEIEIIAREGTIVRACIDGNEVIAELDPLANGSAFF